MLDKITVGQKISQCLEVRVEASGVSRNGSFFARGLLSDKTAAVRFICFDDKTAKVLCEKGSKVFLIDGLVQADSYSGGIQVKVENAAYPDLAADLSGLPEDKSVARKQEQAKNLEEFRRLSSIVKRSGFSEFVSWLEETDYFVAPASANPDYHGCYYGGLLEHSLETYRNLEKLCLAFEISEVDISIESRIITALFHDVCKVGVYKETVKNIKKNGVWEKMDAYDFTDVFPIGHSETSLMYLSRFLRLSENEILAIRWHMGSWDDTARSDRGGRIISDAYRNSKLAVLLHMADMVENFVTSRVRE